MMKKNWMIFLVACFLSLHLGFSGERVNAAGAMFTVNSEMDERDDDPGDGLCETDAGNGVCTLRAAVMETNALAGADMILVPPGTYVLTILDAGGSDENGGLTGDLDILDDLTIQGANQATTTVEGINMVRIFHIVVAGKKVNMSGLTIARNDTNQGGPGGGISNQARLTLDNVAVVENYSGTNGGGIYNTGTVTITNSIISDNDVTQESGGGIFSSGVLVMLNSVVMGNTAGTSGGGIENGGGVMTLRNVLIEQNMATIGSQGGGINVDQNSTTMIIDSDIVDNSSQAGNGGGIFTGILQTTFILNSTIRDNYGARGGGIYNNGNITVMNSTITGNTAGQGGGVSVDGNGSNQTFMYSTIANNISTYNDRAGIEWANNGDRTTFEGVILSGNGDGDDNCWGISPPVSNGYNLDRGTTCGFSQPSDLNNTNPMLGPLADNGGPTLTHALNGNSPAIDAGGGPNCPIEDQRHSLRPKDGDGNGSIVCDIGAYEFFNPSYFAYLNAVFRP